MTFKKTQPPKQGDFALYELWNSYNNIFQLFNPFPDNYSDSEADYYYFGWESVSGDWLIRRRSKTSSEYSDCTSTHNPPHGTLSDSWPLRESLTYP